MVHTQYELIVSATSCSHRAYTKYALIWLVWNAYSAMNLQHQVLVVPNVISIWHVNYSWLYHMVSVWQTFVCKYHFFPSIIHNTLLCILIKDSQYDINFKCEWKVAWSHHLSIVWSVYCQLHNISPSKFSKIVNKALSHSNKYGLKYVLMVTLNRCCIVYISAWLPVTVL